MYKEDRLYTPYVSIFQLYPRLLLLPAMAPPTSSKRSKAYNLAHPLPFDPPAEIKDKYEQVEYQVTLLMACNFNKYPDRQLQLFIETAVTLVCHSLF